MAGLTGTLRAGGYAGFDGLCDGGRILIWPCVQSWPQRTRL